MEAAPKVDGRNMIMVLAPDKRAQQASQAHKKPGGDNGSSPVPADGNETQEG